MTLIMENVEILENRPSGTGSRCCIDLIDTFTENEGLAVGMMSRGLFLIYNESKESQFTVPRPFRVNAGPVSAYTIVPDEGKLKTKYLSELKSGDRVMVVDFKGNTREVEVGRNKIENRPLLFIKARSRTLAFQHHTEKLGVMGIGQDEIYTFVQNAETVMLVNDRKEPIRADQLKRGDRVLASVANVYPVGRHFGMAVKEEFILET